MYHELLATPQNCQWGYFDNSLKPMVTVDSGDIVFIECLTHHAGDAPDLLMDEGVSAVYDANPESDRGPGVHILTGPIGVHDARPGDVLECRFLHAEPRVPYGSNFQANWGLLFSSAREEGAPGIADLEQEEHVTVYEIDQERGTASGLFQYPYPLKPQLPYPGAITPPDTVERQPISRNFRVPLRPHMGVAGVAPAQEGRIDTVPPGPFGGNVDNRSFVPGTSMFYPVMVPDAKFCAGDTHFAEGDGEISGTAIEGHLNCTVQLIVHRDSFKVENPVLETPSELHTHGFHEDLHRAVRIAAVEMIHLLGQRWNLTEREAYSLLSVGGDLRVTQVVNGVKGANFVLSKNLL